MNLTISNAQAESLLEAIDLLQVLAANMEASPELHRIQNILAEVEPLRGQLGG